ncbi:nucleotidyltransferase domain-containing protein [bacterium]|nr:MAG: nucleotidyltransferase domain-containing protein [bacterium]
MYSNKDIEKAKNIILKVIDAEQIILFDSYAEGNYTKDNDIDLMAIIRGKIDRKEKNNILDKMAIIFFENNLNINFFIKTKEDIEKYRNIVGTIIKTALEQGRILWKKD